MIDFNRRADGVLKPTREQKEVILSEMRRGASPAEVARKYGLRIQLVIKWRRMDLQEPLNEALNPSEKKRSAEPEGVPAAEYRKLIEENNRLRKSLANMTLDRDILKDAVDIAAKKKWI
jgi:transposase-like protein